MNLFSIFGGGDMILLRHDPCGMVLSLQGGISASALVDYIMMHRCP